MSSWAHLVWVRQPICISQIVLFEFLWLWNINLTDSEIGISLWQWQLNPEPLEWVSVVLIMFNVFVLAAFVVFDTAILFSVSPHPTKYICLHRSMYLSQLQNVFVKIAKGLKLSSWPHLVWLTQPICLGFSSSNKMLFSCSN